MTEDMTDGNVSRAIDVLEKCLLPQEFLEILLGFFFTPQWAGSVEPDVMAKFIELGLIAEAEERPGAYRISTPGWGVLAIAFEHGQLDEALAYVKRTGFYAAAAALKKHLEVQRSTVH